MFHEDWYSNEQCNDLTNLVKSVTKLNGAVIEIGCWEGKSTINIANACYPNIVICNDTWTGNIEESKLSGVKHITEIILETRNVYNVFLENMNSNTQRNYVVVKEDCIKWLETYKSNYPIKFVHVDASHEYNSVAKTIELLLPHMISGGIICGDDFLNSHMGRDDLGGGVEKAVRDKLPEFKNIQNLWYWVKP